MTSDGTNTYGFDTYNRLTSVTTAAGTASLDYDPLGRFITYTTAAGVQIDGLYDGANSIAQYVGGSLYLRGACPGLDPGSTETLMSTRVLGADAPAGDAGHG